jgi:hypothetical protein
VGLSTQQQLAETVINVAAYDVGLFTIHFAGCSHSILWVITGIDKVAAGGFRAVTAFCGSLQGLTKSRLLDSEQSLHGLHTGPVETPLFPLQAVLLVVNFGVLHGV